MSGRAPLPLGHHPNWLPFVDTLELVLRQIGDPDEAMKILLDAQGSEQVRSLVVVRGVRRLLTDTDKLQVEYPAYWDDDGRQKLSKDAKERRDEVAFVLDGELVLLFVWRPDVEELLGLRPAAVCEEKSARVAIPEPAPRHAGGRPPDPHWEGAVDHVEDWIVEHQQLLPRREDGEPNKAFAKGLIREYFEKNEPPPWPSDESIYRWLRDNPQRWWG